MNYKIRDFSSDISRRFTKIFDNHLFMIFFIVFVVIFGTFGVWVEVLKNMPIISWGRFINSFTTIALLTFSAPLLSVTIFDSLVRLAVKIESDSDIDTPLIVWFSLISIILFVVIALLFYIGSKAGSETVSGCSIAAWFLVLIYWALVNIDNPSYQKPGSTDAAMGTDDATQLRRG